LFSNNDPTKWGTAFDTPGVGQQGIDKKAGILTKINQLRFTRVDAGDSRNIQ